MLIDNALLRFCADKTREIATWYDRDCVLPAERGNPFPRSPHDLHHMMSGRHNKPIFHRRLETDYKDVQYRSFVIPYEDRFEIYYANGMPKVYNRYYQTKELFQIDLYLPEHDTSDIVDLVDNMILRDDPSSHDLNLGKSANSDTLGDIAAMEFLFPLKERRAILSNDDKPNISMLAEKYGVPPFVIQRSFNIVPGLGSIFD